MQLSLSGQSFESVGAKTVVGNAEEIAFVVLEPMLAAPPTPSAVVASVEQELVPAPPPAVVVLGASATITASMPAAATLAGAAEVRAAQGDAQSASTSLVVDFGGLRTVSELVAPSGVTIENVQSWLGTKFDTAQVAGLTVVGSAAGFQELQTERLLVTLTHATTPAAFAAGGSVVIPTSPTNLELLVNGTRAWFKAGAADGSPFTAVVDVGDAVAAAAAQGQAVVLTLRAAAPAALTLATAAQLLRRYPVAFPEGATRTVDAPTEGVYPLSLPIADPSARPDAAGADAWQVQRVVLDVSAKLPPSRVLPPDGPPLSDDAELVLDPDHAVVVRLPPASTAAFAALTGVRLPVVVGPDGAEVAGTLRSGTSETPGDALPKAALGPVTLQPPDQAATATTTWIDLALAAPHPLRSGDTVWLELQAARGSVVWRLAVPGADPAANAALRRRTSGGTYVPLSALEDIPYSGALRLVGQEKPNDPLAAVQVAVAGGTSSVGGVPTQAGATMILGLNPPAATAAGAAGGGDRELPLELTISAPGSYSITAAELQYTTSGG